MFTERTVTSHFVGFVMSRLIYISRYFCFKIMHVKHDGYLLLLTDPSPDFCEGKWVSLAKLKKRQYSGYGRAVSRKVKR